MGSLNGLLRLAALLLLVTAACGESATELAKRERQRAASPNEPEPDFTAVVQPPVFTIVGKLGTSGELVPHAPPGFAHPPGQFYQIDISGTGFPPGKSFDYQILGRFPDGTVMMLAAGGGGVVPTDGSFRAIMVPMCPTRVAEMWAEGVTARRPWKTQTVVPLC